MKIIINRILNYKKRNFNSWLEFIMCFGIAKFEDGGYLLFIYGWGGFIAIFIMYLSIK